MHGIDLTVIGPEVPLARGLADRLRAEGRAVFGPERRGGPARGVQGVRQGGHGRGRRPHRREPDLHRARRRRWRTSTATPSRWWSRRRASPPARARSSAPRGRRPRAPSASMLGERRRSARPARTVVIEAFLEGEEISVLARHRRPRGRAAAGRRRTTSGCSRATPGPTPAAWAPTARWRVATPAAARAGRARGAAPDAGGDAAPRTRRSPACSTPA